MLLFYDRCIGKFFISKLEIGHVFQLRPCDMRVGFAGLKFPWPSPFFQWIKRNAWEEMDGNGQPGIGLSKRTGIICKQVCRNMKYVYIMYICNICYHGSKSWHPQNGTKFDQFCSPFGTLILTHGHTEKPHLRCTPPSTVGKEVLVHN